MKQLPLISIGLPTRNGEKYIGLMLQSLANQTYQNIELIISNNNSTDNTLKICNLYKKYIRNLKVFTQKETLSAVDNFNFVLKKATGVYFMWASDDDALHPNTINSLYEILANKNRIIGAFPLFLNIDGSSCSLTHRYKALDQYLGLELKFNDYLGLRVTDHKANLIYSLFKRADLLAIGGIQKSLTLSGPDIFVVQKLLLKGNIQCSNSHLFYKRIQLFYDRDRMNLLDHIMQAIYNMIQNFVHNTHYTLMCLVEYMQQYFKSLPSQIGMIEIFKYILILVRQLFEQFLLIILSSPNRITNIKDNDYLNS